MKTLKLIITNLILVIALVILTGGSVKAAYKLDVDFNIKDETSTIRTLTFVLKLDEEDGKGLKKVGLEELYDAGIDFIKIRNPEYSSNPYESFYITLKLWENTANGEISWINAEQDEWIKNFNYNDGTKEFTITSAFPFEKKEIKIDFSVSSEDERLKASVIKNHSFENALELLQQAFDEVSLEAVSDKQYNLVYKQKLSALKEWNNNKDFDIIFYDKNNKQITENVVNSSYKIDEYTQKFSEPLYLYDVVRVRFVCTETKLDYLVNLDVPGYVNTNNIGARFGNNPPGQVELYDKITGEVLNVEKIKGLYGFDSTTIASENVNLIYTDTGKLLDKGSLYKNPVNFSNFVNLPDIKSISSDNITLNKVALLLSYCEDIVDNGEEDIKLSLEIIRPNGQSIKIPIDEPAESYFESITGWYMAFDCIPYLEAILQSNALAVGDGGDLKIQTNDSMQFVVDFYVKEGGVYYLTYDDGSGWKRDVYNFTQETYAYNHILPLDKDPSMMSYIYEETIAPAGRFTGAEKNGHRLGEFVNYSDGEITFSDDLMQANCVPLIAGRPYRMHIANINDVDEVTVHFKKVNMTGNGAGNELVEVVDLLNNAGSNLWILQNTRDGYEEVKTAYVNVGDTLFDSLGGMIARFIRTLANGLNWLVQLSLKAASDGSNTITTVDIDSIIFNHYPDTAINFFSKASGGDSPSKLITLLKNGVSDWYNIFQNIAVMGYLAILLYLGIRILLNVGSKKQAQFKQLLTNWIVGLIILFLFPYVIRYAIDINNTFVAMIEESKMNALNITTVKNQIDVSNFPNPRSNKPEDYQAIAAQMEKSPYNKNDNSYMAVMARNAEQSEHVVDAVVYLIMVWQFITIVLLYYKRVFTIAFLIVIFPFVALSYAIDKIADGKAGAFSTWTNEIILNIFTQTIHAIIYVFVIGATYSGGAYSNDWLLSIIGITFLFKGEQILKSIMGQKGDTVKNLAETAKRTVATITAAKVVTKNLADNVVGAKSHLGRSINQYKQWKHGERVVRNMDFLAPTKPPKAPAALPTGVSNTSQNRELANAVDTLNNWHDVGSENEIGKAFDKVLTNYDSKDPEIQKIMGGLQFSTSELKALVDVQRSAVEDAINGDGSTPEKYSALKGKIDKDIEIRLQAIFPGKDALTKTKRETMKRLIYRRMGYGNKDEMHKQRTTNIPEIKKEIRDVRARRESFRSSTSAVNAFVVSHAPIPLSARATATRDSILSTYFKTNYTAATAEQRKYAEKLAMLKDHSESSHETDPAKINKYTPTQMLEATQYIKQHQRDTKENNRAITRTLGVNIDEAESIILEEIGTQFTADIPGESKRNFRTKIQKRGAGANIPPPLTGTNDEKQAAVDMATDTYITAMESLFEKEAESAVRYCSNETIDKKVSMTDELRLERQTVYTDDTYAICVAREREKENLEETAIIRDIAKEQLEDIPKIIINEPTYNGLTKEEYEEYANVAKKKFWEETLRTAATTSGALTGGFIGATLNIGLSDDKSAAEEALQGAVGGALAGDSLAERSLGRVGQDKEVTVINPYTGVKEKIKLPKEGILKHGAGAFEDVNSISPDEVLRADDPRLAHFQYHLDAQFLENKSKYETKKQQDMKKALYTQALGTKKSP